MYMPLMVDVKKAVVFGGERDEGLQKTEKLAVFADELLVVPETDNAPSEIQLEEGSLDRVPESLSLKEPRRIPVADNPATPNTIPGYVEGATFVTSDLENDSLNQIIFETCQENNVLCNVIDVTEQCNTWFMSVIDTPNMLTGFSTKGGCAFYSQQTRIELENQFKKRSEVSRVFTNLRENLREDQCNLCTLSIVYEKETVQDFIAREEWDQLLETGKQLAREVPDDFHVKDHSIEDPREL